MGRKNVRIFLLLLPNSRELIPKGWRSSTIVNNVKLIGDGGDWEDKVE